jgi:hypothetical protein
MLTPGPSLSPYLKDVSSCILPVHDLVKAIHLCEMIKNLCETITRHSHAVFLTAYHTDIWGRRVALLGSGPWSDRGGVTKL